MEIIGLGANGKLIVEVAQTDLKLITGETEDFTVGQVVSVGTDLQVLNQLKKNKTKFGNGLTNLATIINTLS